MMQRLKNKMGSYFRRIRNSITIHVLCYDTFRCLSTGSFIKKHKIISVIIIAALVGGTVFAVGKIKSKNADDAASKNEAEATRMTIAESITGSSTVETNDT